MFYPKDVENFTGINSSSYKFFIKQNLPKKRHKTKFSSSGIASLFFNWLY